MAKYAKRVQYVDRPFAAIPPSCLTSKSPYINICWLRPKISRSTHFTRLGLNRWKLRLLTGQNVNLVSFDFVHCVRRTKQNTVKLWFTLLLQFHKIWWVVENIQFSRKLRKDNFKDFQIFVAISQISCFWKILNPPLLKNPGNPGHLPLVPIKYYFTKLGTGLQ